MDIVTFSEARANLKSVMDKVAEDKVPVIIHRRDGEDMVLLSKADWDSFQETLHLLASPRNAERLLGAIARFKAMESPEAALSDLPNRARVAEDPLDFRHDDAE